MTARTARTYRVERPEQRQALSSAVRLEILGAFTAVGGMSIREVAERMGRPAGSLYYHFRILEKVGLLRRAGERPGDKRPEVLYEPIAPRIELAAPQQAGDLAPVLKTMASAFRMAERDLEAGLRQGTARTGGRNRNLLAFRVHMRLSRARLAELNQHLRAVEQFIERESSRRALPEDADQYCSLTLALLPLRGRGGD